MYVWISFFLFVCRLNDLFFSSEESEQIEKLEIFRFIVMSIDAVQLTNNLVFAQTLNKYEETQR